MDPIKMEKITAMERYKKIQFLQNLFQYLLTALVLAMAISNAFPSSLFSSMKLFFSVSLPRIGAFVISPKCLFIIGNAIVIFLFSESKLASMCTSSQDIYDEYVRHQQSLRRQSSVEAKEKEKGLEVCLGEGDDEEIKGLEEEKKEEEKEEQVKQEEEEKKEKENDQLEEEKAAAAAAAAAEEEEEEEEEKEEEVKQEEEEKKEKENDQLEEEKAAAAEEKEEEEEEEEEEEAGMEADELNRRAEDFIARVTKQFRLEAQMLACGG